MLWRAILQWIWPPFDWHTITSHVSWLEGYREARLELHCEREYNLTGRLCSNALMSTWRNHRCSSNWLLVSRHARNTQDDWSWNQQSLRGASVTAAFLSLETRAIVYSLEGYATCTHTHARTRTQLWMNHCNTKWNGMEWQNGSANSSICSQTTVVIQWPCTFFLPGRLPAADHTKQWSHDR